MKPYTATKLSGKRKGCIRADFYSIAPDGVTIQPRGWLVTRKGETVEAAYERLGGAQFDPALAVV